MGAPLWYSNIHFVCKWMIGRGMSGLTGHESHFEYMYIYIFWWEEKLLLKKNENYTTAEGSASFKITLAKFEGPQKGARVPYTEF